MAWLARPWNSEEPPAFLPRLGIKRGDRPANAIPRRIAITTSDPDNHCVAHNQRSMRNDVTRCSGTIGRPTGWITIIGDDNVPQKTTGLCAKGEEMSIQRSQVDHVVKNRETAIRSTSTARGASAWRRRVAESPEFSAGDPVERHHVIRRIDSIENALRNKRRRFEPACIPARPNPRELEISNVLPRDLVQERVSVTEKVSRVGEPVMGFLIGMNNPLEGHRLKCRPGRPQRFRGSIQYNHAKSV